jgi:sugar phosphate isomerase/epimerase
MTATRVMRLGATLYAFTKDYHAHRYTFDELMAKVDELQLGPGLEIVGFQSIRGYPHIPTEFEDHFKSLIGRYNLEPSCLGANLDMARRPDRLMTPEEEVVYLEAQLEAARILGFPVVRVGSDVTTEALERFLPAAERAQVKIGIELHSPVTVDSPKVTAFRELFDRLQSPYLGFIPDFGASMTGIPPGILKSFRKDGVAPAIVDLLPEVWQKGTDIGDKVAEFTERAKSLGASDTVISKLTIALRLFGQEKPRAWLEIIPQTVHVHGKFYEHDEAGNEPVVPYAELIDVLVEGGFSGVMSLEWEGHIWEDEVDAFTVVKRQHDLCQRLLAAATTATAGIQR